jgi:hypothetical protein
VESGRWRRRVARELYRSWHVEVVKLPGLFGLGCRRRRVTCPAHVHSAARCLSRCASLLATSTARSLLFAVLWWCRSRIHAFTRCPARRLFSRSPKKVVHVQADVRSHAKHLPRDPAHTTANHSSVFPPRHRHCARPPPAAPIAPSFSTNFITIILQTY